MEQLKILVVDDDPNQRRGLKIRLRAKGFGTAHAADGRSAIAVAVKEQPDLIILDLGLPSGDGLVVLRHLSEIRALSNIPVIVVTARDPRLNEDESLKAGALAFFQKPVDNDALMDTIYATLSKPRLDANLPS